ncbi:MAG TPA: nucleotide sugar dehydrogenase [Actinobacteria bacterium]|nr:nucleotide sugar dehydrogenase [Actinomycetota bacterium]
MSDKKQTKGLAQRIASKKALVAIVGLGHVGLIEAVTFAKAGFKVTGFDINKDKIRALKRGESSSADVNNQDLKALVNSGDLTLETSPSNLAKADVIIITVPTLLSRHKNPDVNAVWDVARHIVHHAKTPVFVSVESTCYPGATEELFQNLFSKHFEADRDLFLACAPARIDPGNKEWPLPSIPRIIGGLTPKSLELARSLYDQVVTSIIPASSLKAAEMTKLMENSFRTVNIAFANQMQIICHEMGINVWEIIKLAATKPFGFVPFYPGPGPGGTCIPVDPFYVSWKAREYEYHARFIELAGEVLDEIPGFLLKRLYDMLNGKSKAIENSKILLLGVAYKKDTAEISGAAAHSIVPRLMERGAKVFYHDPYVNKFRTNGTTLNSTKLSKSFLKSLDATIILTDHSQVDYELIVRNNSLILDTRNALADYDSANIHK